MFPWFLFEQNQTSRNATFDVPKLQVQMYTDFMKPVKYSLLCSVEGKANTRQTKV